MSENISVELLERVRPSLATMVAENAKRLPGLRYCDVRVQVSEEKGAVAENGQEKASAEDQGLDFGVRVIAGGKTAAPGYYGTILGARDTDSIEKVVWEGIQQAHQRAPGPTPA